MSETIPPRLRVFTTHGTVFHIVPETGELRHGAPAISPPNARFVLEGAMGRVMRVAGTELLPVVCAAERSAAASGATGATRFEIVPVDHEWFGLRANGLFLCAEFDGRVTLSRAGCGGWEKFRLAAVPPVAKIAAFTTVYNEATFFSLWRAYYGDALGATNLFVLDHGSDDGGTDDLGVINRIRVPRDGFDDEQRLAFVNRFQTSLLAYYDVVIFTDPDEFLVPDPAKYAGLADFINRRCDQYVTAVGLDVKHVPDIEPPIDLAAPILSQRKYVQFAADYSKSLIARIPLAWIPGFHSCDHPPSVDPDLYLFHLKTMDRDLALRQLRKSRSTDWTDSAIAKAHGLHNRSEDEAFVRRYFPHSADSIRPLVRGFDFSEDLARFSAAGANTFQDFKGTVAEIPPRFRHAIGAAIR